MPTWHNKRRIRQKSLIPLFWDTLNLQKEMKHFKEILIHSLSFVIGTLLTSPHHPCDGQAVSTRPVHQHQSPVHSNSSPVTSHTGRIYSVDISSWPVSVVFTFHKLILSVIIQNDNSKLHISNQSTVKLLFI